MVGTTLFFINVEGLTSRQAPGYENIDFMTFFDVRALKWPQNGPEPKKKYSGLIDLQVCPLTIAGIPITLLGDHFEIGVIFELFGTKLV